MSDFQVGDLVKFTRVFRVTDADDEYIDGTDEKSGRAVRFMASLDTQGNASKFELLHRPAQKPAVGTSLSGEDVHDTKWKRGTILVGSAGTLLLKQDGDWVRDDGLTFGFGSFLHSPWSYTVVYLPAEK